MQQCLGGLKRNCKLHLFWHKNVLYWKMFCGKNFHKPNSTKPNHFLRSTHVFDLIWFDYFLHDPRPYDLMKIWGIWFGGYQYTFLYHFHKSRPWVLLSGRESLAKHRVYEGGQVLGIFTQMKTWSYSSM